MSPVSEPPSEQSTLRRRPTRPVRLLALLGAIVLAGTLLLWKLDRDATERGILTKALIAAAQNGDISRSRELLARGADANGRVGVDQQPGFLRRFAVIFGYGRPEETGDALIVEAAYRRKPAIVEALLARGADPNGRTTHGETALHWAARHADADSARVLLARHANPNARTDQGETPLHWASDGPYHELMSLLLSHGADPDLARRQGITPLMEAATRKDVRAVRILLDHNADVKHRDDLGSTALGRAKRRSAIQIANMIEQRGGTE